MLHQLSPKLSVSLKVGLTFVVFIGISLLFLNIFTPSPTELSARILSTSGAVTPMTYLNDAPDWDVVCYLDPYSLPSQRLPQYVPAVGSGARYIPEDEWIDEEEYGFAFIDRDTLTVSIFELDKLKVYRIIGPQCVSRATARFRTDKIDAPNLDYIRMTIIGTL